MILTDIHCHLIPGVDDGSSNLEETRVLLTKEYEDGVRRIIFTPHLRPGYFEEPPRVIKKQYLKAKELAAELGMQVFLGCEFYRQPDLLELLLTKRGRSMAGTRYVLIEFSPGDEFSTVRSYVSELVMGGFIPIVAHIERYTSCYDLDRIQELRELGGRIQINAGSVLGDNKRKVKSFCFRLMKADLVDFIASDAHDLKWRPPNLGRCAAYVAKKMGEEYAHQIFVENPKKIFYKS